MWKAERGYLGSHRGLVGKYKRLSGSRSMDSPYCSSCGRFGLGHIQEGGWERDLQLDPSGGGVEGINRLMVCLNWLPSLKRERGRGLMVVVCEIIHITCTNQTFLIPPLSIKCKPSPARNQETETFRQAMDWLDLMIRTQMDKPPPLQPFSLAFLNQSVLNTEHADNGLYIQTNPRARKRHHPGECPNQVPSVWMPISTSSSKIFPL